MESAIALAKEQGFVPEAPKAGLPLPRPDRRLISDYLLELYCSATGPNGNPNRVEYIWLDERCLSDDDQQDNEETSKTQRSIELGKLADIFRGATQVAVFCHEENCDHTTLQCTWGQRLFTLPEILHAEKVLRLTRSVRRDGMTAKFVEMEGYKFREAMQTNAAKHNKWHSFAMFQHFVNAGSIPWQQAVHALIVEAIRRDEAGDFHDHKYLGKVLNGLLPRRARIEDLGNGRWRDLAWLLELNQASYNAASLAAVCSISEDNTVNWLGKPIHPRAGNERLEPLVRAFPVSLNSDVPLMIIGGEALGFRSKPLKRDRYGLYNNDEMKGIKVSSFWIAILCVTLGSVYVGIGLYYLGVGLYLLGGLLYCCVELFASTIYVERDGWVFLEDKELGDDTAAKLGPQDYNLRILKLWGLFSLRSLH
ncbi:hypothetical protein B0H16DRAFT_1330394 [Mycena metata]|uniref:Heterokaryon incompatibility domain-containing protein n=1 Tax=Mycena metata TaxID=1033252 RepID=A0AAD7MT37_9AGAR|nr:hypothetical protein B0H16DRAFT_1330394 [Mycena metata]